MYRKLYVVLTSTSPRNAQCPLVLNLCTSLTEFLSVKYSYMHDCIVYRTLNTGGPILLKRGLNLPSGSPILINYVSKTNLKVF